MCIAFSFTGVSAVIYVISRLSPNEWKVEEGRDGEDTIENEFTVKNSAWFEAGALMSKGSELSPLYVIYFYSFTCIVALASLLL